MKHASLDTDRRCRRAADKHAGDSTDKNNYVLMILGFLVIGAMIARRDHFFRFPL